LVAGRRYGLLLLGRLRANRLEKKLRWKLPGRRTGLLEPLRLELAWKRVTHRPRCRIVGKDGGSGSLTRLQGW
jgi:hypothetical protein